MDLYNVTWQACWMDADSLHDRSDLDSVFSAYMQQRADSAQHVRQDSDFDSFRRQGISERDIHDTLMHHPDMAQLISIQPLTTCQPDDDREGNGAYAVCPSLVTPDLCSVHTPSGQTVGHMDTDRLELLRQAFVSGTHSGFEAAVASLVHHTQRTSKQRRPQALLECLLKALLQGHVIETALFASAVNLIPAQGLVHLTGIGGRCAK